MAILRSGASVYLPEHPNYFGAGAALFHKRKGRPGFALERTAAKSVCRMELDTLVMDTI